jgi:hypothetical protein
VYSANRFGSETAPVIADAVDNTSPRRLTLKEASMELLLIIIVLFLLFGGGGYFGRRRGYW